MVGGGDQEERGWRWAGKSSAQNLRAFVRGNSPGVGPWLLRFGQAASCIAGRQHCKALQKLAPNPIPCCLASLVTCFPIQGPKWALSLVVWGGDGEGLSNLPAPRWFPDKKYQNTMGKAVLVMSSGPSKRRKCQEFPNKILSCWFSG